MHHPGFCKALWAVPVRLWQLDEAMDGHPELAMDRHIITLKSGDTVAINGVDFDLYGINGLRDKVIEHWLDNCLPCLIKAAKRHCLGG